MNTLDMLSELNTRIIGGEPIYIKIPFANTHIVTYLDPIPNTLRVWVFYDYNRRQKAAILQLTQNDIQEIYNGNK